MRRTRAWVENPRIAFTLALIVALLAVGLYLVMKRPSDSQTTIDGGEAEPRYPASRIIAEGGPGTRVPVREAPTAEGLPRTASDILVLNVANHKPQRYYQFWLEPEDRLLRTGAGGVLPSREVAGVNLEVEEPAPLVSVQPGFVVERVRPASDEQERSIVLVHEAGRLQGIVSDIPDTLSPTLRIDLDYRGTVDDGPLRRAVFKTTGFPPAKVRPDGRFEIRHRHQAPARARLFAVDVQSGRRYPLAEARIDPEQTWLEFDLAGIDWDTEQAFLNVELEFHGPEPQGTLTWSLFDESGQKVRSGKVSREGRAVVRVSIEGLQIGRHRFQLRSPKFGSVAIDEFVVDAPRTERRVVVPLGGSLRVDVPGVAAERLGRWDLLLVIRRLDGSLVDSAYPASDGETIIRQRYLAPGSYFARVRVRDLERVSPTLHFRVSDGELVHLVAGLRAEHRVRVRFGGDADSPFCIEVRSASGELVDAARLHAPFDSVSFWLFDGVYHLLRTDSSKRPLEVRVQGEDVEISLAR